MYRPSNKIEKLPRLSAAPSIDDVTSVMELSRQNTYLQYELSWLMIDELYRLLVSCPKESSEPSWNLMIGEGRDEIEVWTYQTGDVSLVYNLVLAESTESMNQDMSSRDILGQSETRNIGLSGTYSTSLLGLSSLTSTHQKIPVFNLDEQVGPAAMEGTIDEGSVPTLLQSINMGKRSGRLAIINEQSMAELFFNQGELYHASALNQIGDGAIMEIVTWESGKFYFYNDEASDEKTINRRIDAILMESITLLDQTKYLMKTGFDQEKFLLHKYPNLSEQQFEQAVSNGAPCDQNLQKQFYLRLDGNTSMFDMLRERPMTKKEWVPIMFNMLQADLIFLSEKPLTPDKTAHLSSVKLDRNAIDSIKNSFLRQETGLYSYNAFQFFLEQELVRHKYGQSPFAVVNYDLGINRGGTIGSLNGSETLEATKRINSIMRPIDIVAHFETLSYIMLLPTTDTKSASIFVHRVVEILRQRGLSAGMDPTNLCFAFGVAAVPEDCKDVGLLLSAAKVAKKVAQSSAMPIVLFKDLKAPSE